MQTSRVVLLLAAVAALAGCASDKSWMKVGEPYTTAEFRKDYADCSKTRNGKLDEECLRGRGWVEMKPSRGDRAADTPPTPPQDWRLRR
ncbi:MAG TPA: hypothetical protein VGT02_16710 [Methylomirabilota bacterium]|jgi:hypothetical protein|nr:hypothetical protein [Methylomirabilota bacterium]